MRLRKFMLSIVFAVFGVIGCLIFAVACLGIPIIGLVHPEYIKWDKKYIGVNVNEEDTDAQP